MEYGTRTFSDFLGLSLFLGTKNLRMAFLPFKGKAGMSTNAHPTLHTGKWRGFMGRFLRGVNRSPYSVLAL